MTKERRLGRGLEALLGKVDEPAQAGENGVATAPPAPPAEPAPESATMPGEAAMPNQVALDSIDPNPYQPRQSFDEEEIAALAMSLEDHGLLQPIVVRRDGDRYQLVAGERRLRAARLAGWSQVPIQLAEADERQMAELAIVENLQRKDLNPLEKAASFSNYIEAYGTTHEELASRLKIDRSTVANLIRLLELPESVQAMLRTGRITQGHARALLPLGDEREQVAFGERIQAERLSVRQTEAAVQEVISEADREPLSVATRAGSPRGRSTSDEHLAALEQEIRAVLGTKVKLTANAKGRGKLTIHFANHAEFERIRDHICELPEIPAKAG